MKNLWLFVLFEICFLQIVTSQTNSGDSSIDAKCQAARTCRECILADPNCTWCAQFNKTELRCRVLSKNEATCTDSIQNPRSNATVTKDAPFSDVSQNANTADRTVIQLRPQALNVNLRLGIPQTVNLTFRRVIDYPLDLYYVMDLSFSMQDDLKKLQSLGNSLFNDIRNLTNNVQLGFGTFVDKVMLPFASTIESQLKDPCFNDPKAICAPVFGFRHQLPLTSNESAFTQAVDETKISGNIDSPEGGFDALMQIAICEQIQWRNVSLRVILYASDASPHIAMDGKLAAILDVNDMQCHLKKNVHKYYNSSFIYADSKIQDYPSVGQLKKIFQEQKVQPVFAVTQEVFPLYKKLQELLDPAYVDILANDSKNIISLISTSYNQIRGRVQLNVPAIPSNIDMTYRVLCPNSIGWKEKNLECSNVFIDDEVTFQFTLISTSCPPTSQSTTVQINSNSIQDTVSMTIDSICECDCKKDGVPNSPLCEFNGAAECGMCVCNENKTGSRCQCFQSTSGTPLEQNCTQVKYKRGDPTCSSNGVCECGICECNGNYFGKFCQCNILNCPKDDEGFSCGGVNRGKCEKCESVAECKCINGWSLDDRGVCSCSNSLCTQNSSSSPCNEKGFCNCDRCVCNSQYSGLYCQTCIHPSCLNIKGTCTDQTIQTCVSCLYDADRLNKEVISECRSQCGNQPITFQLVDSLPAIDSCRSNLDNISSFCNSIDVVTVSPVSCTVNPIFNCIAKYIIAWSRDVKQYRLYVQKFQESDCPTIDPLLIILPVTGGILLLGLIALIVWKILQTLRDKREYERFMTDVNNPNWAKGKSNLYVDPNSRIQNPLFQDDDEKAD